MKIPITYFRGDTSPLPVRVFKCQTDSIFFHMLVRGRINFNSDFDKCLIVSYLNGNVK